MLFGFHIVVNFPLFLLLLIFSSIPLHLEKIVEILIFLNLLILVSWSNMWPILENIPCMLEKNMYSSTVGWKVKCISVRTIRSIILFEWVVSPLVFYLGVLSVFVSWIIKSSAIIALLSISTFRYINIHFIHLSALMFNIYIIIVISSYELTICSVFVSRDPFWLKALFLEMPFDLKLILSKNACWSSLWWRLLWFSYSSFPPGSGRGD